MTPPDSAPTPDLGASPTPGVDTVAPTDWRRAVAVQPLGDGVYAADLDAGWSVGGGINGGYLMARTGEALAQVLPGKPHPVAFSTHFLSAGVAGPAEVRTRVLRDGGSTATLAAELVQDGQVRLAVLATYGDLDRLPDDVRTSAEPFPLAGLEACVSTRLAPEEVRAVAPLMQRFDLRLDPDCVGWALGEPSMRGELRAWFRVDEDTVADPVQLLLAVDALPPVTFDLDLPGWAPTLELTAHVRARPAPGWLRLRHATRNVAGGMFEEDCEVWDSAGRLVAQSRQLARLPRA